MKDTTIHGDDEDGAIQVARIAVRKAAMALQDEACVASAQGDLKRAALLHAGAMALAAMHRRATRSSDGDDAALNDYESRAALAALEAR